MKWEWFHGASEDIKDGRSRNQLANAIGQSFIMPMVEEIETQFKPHLFGPSCRPEG